MIEKPTHYQDTSGGPLGDTVTITFVKQRSHQICTKEYGRWELLDVQLNRLEYIKRKREKEEVVNTFTPRPHKRVHHILSCVCVTFKLLSYIFRVHDHWRKFILILHTNALLRNTKKSIYNTKITSHVIKKDMCLVEETELVEYRPLNIQKQMDFVVT